MNKSRRTAKILDYAVSAMIIVACVIGVIPTIDTVALPFAILACIVLLLWLVKGDGAQSNLWNWLPPFWCFRHFGYTGRLMLIIMLALGALGCVVAFLFGI